MIIVICYLHKLLKSINTSFKPKLRVVNYRKGCMFTFDAFFVMHGTVGNLSVAQMSFTIFPSYQINPNQSTSRVVSPQTSRLPN